MLFALFSLSDPAEACDHPTTRAELQADLAGAEAAFKGMDLAAFQSAYARASTSLSCLSERIDTPDASRYHRAAGLAAFFGRDVAGAQRAFAAARALDPAFAWDPAAAPAGGPVQIAYTTMAVDNPQRSSFAAPTGGSAWVDGVKQNSRPAGWPSIVQVLGPTDGVLSTTWLRAEDPLPAFPTALPVASSTTAGTSGTTTATVSPKKNSLKAPLLITAGAAALGAAALYGGAWAVRQNYDASSDYTEMESLKGTNQALFWSSVGVGGIAVATGVVGVVATSF